MENRENRKDGRVKGFDELYFEICAQVKENEEKKKNTSKDVMEGKKEKNNKKNEIDLLEKKKTDGKGEAVSSSGTNTNSLLDGSSSSDLNRVYDILQKHPFIITKFSSTIQEYYDGKNELKAQELLEAYRREKEKFETSIEGLVILNQSLRLAPISLPPPATTTFSLEKLKNFEPVNLDGSVSQNKTRVLLGVPNFTVLLTKKNEKTTEEKKVVSTEKFSNDKDDEETKKEKVFEGNDDDDKNLSPKPTLVGQIYLARARWFHSNSEHESCILDTYRSIRFGVLPSFSTIFTLATSYKEIGQLDGAFDLFEQALSFLRQSSFDNLTKSTQTIRIVRELKEIKSKSNLDLKNVPLPYTPPNSTNNNSRDRSSGDSWININFLEPLKKIRKGSSSQLPKVQLYEKSNSVLVSASDALELTYSKEMGRQLIAKRTISPGTVLMIDPAYAWSLYPKSYEAYCQNCCLKVQSPVPCDHCSAVFYCDEGCNREFDPIHRYECRILKLLDSSKCLGEMSVLVYRTITRSTNNKIDGLLEALGKEEDEIQELQEVAGTSGTTTTPTTTSTFENPTEELLLSSSCSTSSSSYSSPQFSKKKSTENQFQLILGLDSEGQLNPLKFHSVSAQISNSFQRPKADVFKRTLGAIYFTLVLKFMNWFPSQDQNQPDTFTLQNIQISSIILKIFQSVSCNAYSISDAEGRSVKELEIREIGGCTFPTVSCTNHSCAPNIYRYNWGNTSIIRSISTILPGQPILDSYGPVYTSMEKEERQKVLEKQYFFTCTCPACEENWPIYSKLINIERKNELLVPNIDSFHNSHGKRTRRRQKQRRNNKGKETGCQNPSSKGIKFPYAAPALPNEEEEEEQVFQDSLLKYSRSKESLISGKIITQDMESIFCHHLSLLEKLYTPPPHKLIVECQETLKLLWNLSMGKE